MQPLQKKEPGKIYIDSNKFFIVIVLCAFLLVSFQTVMVIQAHKLSVACKNFSSHKQAQAYYDSKQKGYRQLYANHGIVCQKLPQGK